MKPHAMRRRKQLVDAMEYLLTQGELPTTLAELGKAAGMSTATAYRYFQSLEEVAQAYLIRTMTTLRDFSVTRSETGSALLYTISRFWIDIVIAHGQVLVQIRSRRGFYDRLQRHVTSTALGVEARRRAILEVLTEHALPDAMFEDAAMLYNTLFDPREILDLIHLRGLAPDTVATVLVSAFVGALQGWHAGIHAQRATVRTSRRGSKS